MENVIDKSKELKTTINLLNEKLHFEGNVNNNQPVSIDYIPPFGDNLGYTSLELFLLSLSSCLGSAVLIFLRRTKKNINDFKISTTGIRHDEHPTGFKKVLLTIHITSPDITADELKKFVKLSEDTYCPVWSMIKGNVEVEVSYEIKS